MGKGLFLTTLEIISQNVVETLYEVKFSSVLDIRISSGLTRLANDFIFYLLSTYDPDTGVGSNVTTLIGRPVLFSVDKNQAVVQIVDELEDTVERFKTLQRSRNVTIPLEEQLIRARIERVVVDPEDNSILVELELINAIGQRGKFVL